jgi:dolichol-phosphate mannosyltransferase
MKKKVSIVLPVFNERYNLEKTILSILHMQKFLKNYSLEIVVSDSCSTDGSVEIAQKMSRKYKNVHYINVEHGLGVGLYEGHRYAIKCFKPDILVQIDADGQVDEKVIPLLIKTIDQGYDLALGSRFVAGGKNKLSIVRKLFSLGSSYVCRVIMGPIDIGEFTNSARAFTPDLFKRINWKRLPCKRKTFIVMPAFLNEAILVGAKYKEVPLIFKNRSMGYSKNKIINYTFDIIVYSIEARLRKWGMNILLFNIIRGGNRLKW